MDDNKSLLPPPADTGCGDRPKEPWRWHEETVASLSTAAPRHLGAVAESEWFSVLAQIISSALLFGLIFGMSATVDVRRLQEQARNKFAILTGVATQFIIMPILGYVSVVIFNGRGLKEPMAVSLLIVTASPGGSYSNWWCSVFNADLALSVAMTAVSTMISCIMLPVNLLVYVKAAIGSGLGSDSGEAVFENIDWPSLFVSLAIVIVAIGTGLCASFKISSNRFHRFANRMGSMSGLLLIIFSAVVPALSGSNEAQIWGQPWSFYVGIISPCFVGLFIATFFAAVARLKRPEVISVGVECCYQNVGIATSAAVAMFDDPLERGQALCVPLFYGLVEGLLLGLYCLIGWKLGWTKAPRDEKFCVAMLNTYEVDGGTTENSELAGGPSDEERQHGADDPRVSSDTSWPTGGSSWGKPWALLFRTRKRKGSEETEISMESSPGMSVSLGHSINESLEAIAQLDSITNLVSLPPPMSVEYSRCRVNSEDGMAYSASLTEVASNNLDGSLANSSAAESPK